MSRIAIDLGGTAIFNLAAEFWQDLKTTLFTRQSGIDGSRLCYNTEGDSL